MWPTAPAQATPEVVSFPPQTAQYVAVALAASSHLLVVDRRVQPVPVPTAPRRWAGRLSTVPAGWPAPIATLSADAPANALDDKLGTGFSTDQPQAARLYFEVDMGSKATFDELAMAVPNSPTDYARGYGVEVSNDGKRWSIVATCTGASTPEVVSFPAQTAQYVRVALAASSTYWWSIDEFNLYSLSGATPSITSAASVQVAPGTATSFTITSTGSPTPSLSESGTLPPGLAFHASTNGTAVISGTPPANASGTYDVVITATNSMGSATEHLVMSLVAKPSITSAASVQAAPGTATSFTITSTGSPTPSLSESGTLPPGLAFHASTNGTAVISGTPPANASGTYDVVITATNSMGSATEHLVMSLVAKPSITSAASVQVAPGTATSFTITSTGSPTPSLSESGTLPPGLAFHASTNGTAVISGTPPANASGTYDVVITATNSMGSATEHFVMSLVVTAPPKQAAISLSSSPNPALVGRAVTYTARIEPALSAGTIMFMSNGTVVGDCRAVPVNAGEATCTVTYGSGGARQVTAEYLGSLGYTSSVSAPDTENVTVSTSTSMAVTANPASIGKPVTYVATVSPAVHVGTVTFTQNGAVVAGCAAVPVSAGRATCTITYWAGGHHMVQASYSGLNGRAASVSALSAESISFPPTGYWLATKSGDVYAAGQAAQLGGFPTSAATGPVMGMAHTPSRRGYWVVSSKGTVKAFGNAKFYGDLATAGVRASDIVAIAGTHDGHGYWLIGRDGGMFTFGDAKFHGSVPGLGRHISDIVGMVASTDGAGYLLVGSDGGVFTFGSAHFYGSLPGLGKHVTDIRAILPSSTTRGYVLVGADGGAFVFGSGVKFMGSLPGEGIKVKDIIGLALTPDGSGYYMAASNGSVFGFGSAKSSPAPSGLSLPVVAISGA